MSSTLIVRTRQSGVIRAAFRLSCPATHRRRNHRNHGSAPHALAGTGCKSLSSKTSSTPVAIVAALEGHGCCRCDQFRGIFHTEWSLKHPRARLMWKVFCRKEQLSGTCKACRRGRCFARSSSGGRGRPRQEAVGQGSGELSRNYTKSRPQKGAGSQYLRKDYQSKGLPSANRTFPCCP